jgi:hypothetical protein
VLFIGRAQERTAVFRTEKRRNHATGATYPWIVRTSAMVNHFYIYAVDADFGPFFVKFCSYFPYNAKLCINGNEWAKRQAAKTGLVFEPLDNGFAACDRPERLQRICDRLGPAQIDRLLRKWLGRLPHPFTAADRRAGYRYDISVLQAEFSLTQMLDRPLLGRVFFEEVVRENIDIGRPDRVSLIFDRRLIGRGRHPTPSRFRTRVFTDGVTPSTAATSGSASGCATCPRCGKSASLPTGDSSPLNESPMTRPSATRSSLASLNPSSSTVNEHPRCASVTHEYTLSSWPSQSPGSSPKGSPTANSESISPHCWASPRRHSAPAA